MFLRLDALQAARTDRRSCSGSRCGVRYDDVLASCKPRCGFGRDRDPVAVTQLGVCAGNRDPELAARALGRLEKHELFELTSEHLRANRDARGTRGDRLALWSRPGRSAYVWGTFTTSALAVFERVPRHEPCGTCRLSPAHGLMNASPGQRAIRRSLAGRSVTANARLVGAAD